jgi:hypothetical protein
MGNVSRVDFTPIHKKRTLFTDSLHDGEIKSAFVHFHSLIDSQSVKDICLKLDNGESISLNDVSSNNEYWIILKNKNPIPDTYMNSSQIVENCRLLEQNHLSETERLWKIIEGTRNTVYQLVGGLYNHNSQYSMIHMHEDVLFPHSQSQCKEDDNIWRNVNIWPTTRQGDQLEKKLQEQDKIIKQQSQTIDELSKQIKSTQYVVRKLLDGVYHQHKQRKMIRMLNNDMYQIDEMNPYFDDIDPYDNFPTTRQGDELEKKVAELENKIAELLQK